MLLTIINPNDPRAYKNKRLCHRVTIEHIVYVSKKMSDQLIMVGDGTTVFHSFVVNAYGEIIFDNNIKKNPYYDGKYYEVDNKRMKFMMNKTRKTVLRDLNYFSNKEFVD